MSCRSKTKPKKRTPCPKKYFLLNSVWLDREVDDFKHFYKLKRFGQLRYWVILLNTSHLNPELSKLSRFAAPAQNSTAPPKISVGNSSHPFPRLPDSAQRCLATFVSDIVASEVKLLHRGVLHGLHKHLQLRGSAPQVQKVCRSCRARDGYN